MCSMSREHKLFYNWISMLHLFKRKVLFAFHLIFPTNWYLGLIFLSILALKVIYPFLKYLFILHSYNNYAFSIFYLIFYSSFSLLFFNKAQILTVTEWNKL